MVEAVSGEATVKEPARHFSCPGPWSICKSIDVALDLVQESTECGRSGGDAVLWW